MKKNISLLFTSLVITGGLFSQTITSKPDTIIKTLSSTAINRVVTSPSVLPDLFTTINAIEKSGNFYTIKFTTKNQGGGSVDISKVAMQGNVYTNTGSFIIAGGFRTLGSSGTLAAGQSVQGYITCTLNSVLYDNENYYYRITTDNQQAVTESNETNNTAELTFKGHTATGGILKVDRYGTGEIVRKTAPDLIIEIKNITSSPTSPLDYTATYVIKNIGTGAIDLKDYSIQGYIREASNAIYTACGGHRLMYEGIILNPGKEFTGTRGISANVVTNKGYKFKIEIKFTGQSTSNPETRTDNNAWEMFFTAGN
jgi:hypothetical protein